MEGIKDNNKTSSNIKSEDDTKISIKFLIETIGKFKNNSTVELSNQKEALDLFNQKSKEGKDTILYEVHRTSEDGKVVKKVPVLNSSKAAERMKILQKETEESIRQKSPTNFSTTPAALAPEKKKEKVTLASMKYKIIILVAVVIGFIMTLFIVSMIADINSGGGSMAGHHLISYEVVQKISHSDDYNIKLVHFNVLSL